MVARLETRGSNVPLDSVLKQLQPTGLQVTLPTSMYSSTRLRHLTVDNLRRRPPRSIPPMRYLASLDIEVNQAEAPGSATRRPFVNLSHFTRLQRLHIRGGVWSKVSKTFTGESRTVKTCILQGPLVVGKRSDDFFERIATGLESVFCQGTHLIGELQTSFPRLDFLALHKTVRSTGTLAFRSSSIRAVSLEADDSYGPGRVQDLNDLLQLVLTHTKATLRFLALRSGLPWAPSFPTIQSFQQTSYLSAVMLDGAVTLERKDWMAIESRLKLDLVAIIDTWVPSGVSKCEKDQDSPSNGQRQVMMTPLRSGSVRSHSRQTTFVGHKPSEACRCGHLTRRFAFRSVGIEGPCFDIYSWLVADLRTSDCTHEDVSQEGVPRSLVFDAVHI